MSQPSSHTTTDFGYERVRREDKARRVRGVFDSVADNYDLMNDLMSGGAHRLWKRFTLSITGLRPGQVALDVAGGTGDIALGLARQVGTQGLVVLTDINAAMLAHGRDRLIDAGHVRGVECVQANAEQLPFADGSFHLILSRGPSNLPPIPNQGLLRWIYDRWLGSIPQRFLAGGF